MNCNTHNSQIFIQDPDFQIPIQTLTLAPNFTIHDLKQLFFKNKSYASTLTSSSYFTLNGRILPDNGTVKTTGDMGRVKRSGLRPVIWLPRMPIRMFMHHLAGDMAPPNELFN